MAKNNEKPKKKQHERAEPPFALGNNYRDGFAAVAKLLEGRKNVLVLAGAGISVSCGIPDFRSRGSGLYSSLNAEVSFIFHLSYSHRPNTNFAVLTFSLRRNWACLVRRICLIGIYLEKTLDPFIGLPKLCTFLLERTSGWSRVTLIDF
jgi:hypothetical protein